MRSGQFCDMRNLIFLFLALAAWRADAQTTLSAGDSTARQINPRSIDSIYVDLRDGDYARFTVSNPPGFTVDVFKPDRSILKSFITIEDKGTNDVSFGAEGGGRYIVVIKNTTDSAREYRVAFSERAALDERMRPLAWRDSLSSPIIERIRKAIESGNTNTGEFWKAIEKTGTPIVEPKDSNYDLVTFLWRAQHDTRGVHVNATFEIPDGRNRAMHRIGESDIWYLTVKMPKGARFMYQLEPNRPSDPDADRVTRQVDPPNHGEKYQCPNEISTYRCYSIGELPEAVPQPWLAKHPGVATGSIERKKIHSAIQNVDRDLTVYLPAGYARNGKPYDLVMLFDGDDFLDSQWKGQNTWDNLIASRRVPPFVVVMVHNLPGRRLFDLVANRAFADFIAKELAPWIRAHYNVTRDAKRTVIGGASAGGFGATYVGLVHPEVYGNVLSMSGAFWWSPEHNGGICAGMCAAPNGRVAVANRDASTEPNWMARVALGRQSIPARFFLSVGMFEFDQSGGGGNILEETRRLRDVLRAKNGRVIFEEFVGGHDGLGWRGMLGEGLIRLRGM
jgi:enterochelin esterase family protein